MEKLSREQILDSLARAEAELLRIRISRQPQLLKKPLGFLRQADNACNEGLPPKIYETKYKQFFLTLCQAMEQTIEQDDRKNLKEITELSASILGLLYEDLKYEPSLSRLARKKKEIVFLPYKAAMWDSLESIWRAATDDTEHCHTYVVPIPYADRNPDGTAKAWHNEKDLFPSYVPTLDYEKFDLEALRPDIIFIHNPYDQYNRVISVDSHFYSDKLKKYTDKLVYVPYFVLGEPQLDYDDPEKKEENEEAEENIAHFITTPGVLNADLTIVQSEAMKKVYVNVLNRHTNAPEGYWEEHIMGLGSPKFDKVAESKKEDLDLPEHWMKIIRKPDGDWKKIVFYNTGLSAFLEHNEKMVEKIRQVLQIFKEHKDEIALLWRPHPLMRATLHSMRPEMEKEYEEIVSWYKKEAWGIYDDSADLDRAIVISDAYYGDGSSVVQLYEKCEKPIMIQNVFCLDEKRYRRLRFIDYYDDGENLWFSALHQNMIFKYQKSTGATKLVAVLPADVLMESYRGVYKKGTKLYLAPIFARNMIVVDVNSGRCSYHLLSEKYLPSNTQPVPMFSRIFEYQNDIYVIPFIYGAILRICPTTQEITYYDGIRDLTDSLQQDGAELRFSDACICGNHIYMTSDSVNIVIDFNLSNKEFQIHRIGEIKEGYNTICAVGEQVFLFHRKSATIIVWNTSNNSVRRIQVKPHGKYDYLRVCGDAVVRIPCKGDLEIEKVGIKLNTHVSSMNLNPKSNEYDVSDYYPENTAALCAHIEKNEIYIFTTKRDSLCVYDSNGKYMCEHTMLVDEPDLHLFADAQRERMKIHFATTYSKIIFEDYFSMNLPCYCSYIIGSDRKEEYGHNYGHNYGNSIYEYAIRGRTSNGKGSAVSQ